MTPLEWDALRLSCRVATLTLLVSLVPGVAVGWWLARSTCRYKGVVSAILHLPLVLPPVVTGTLLLYLLGRRGVLGGALDALGIRLAFTWWGGVIASAVMAFPLLVRAVRLAIEMVDPGLEAAGRTLGAGPLRVFLSITLPLALPGVFAGAVLTFARSLGEFGATITFAGNIPGATQTLPLAIYAALQLPGAEAGVSRLLLLSAGLSLGAVLAAEALMRRRAHD